MLYVDIEKKLNNFTLKVKLSAQEGISAIAGPSGAGKSMTLKCIAGIEKPDRGIIRYEDKVFFDSEKHINLSPQKRKTGYLFQDYALFPNMNVRSNIISGLHHLKRSERKDAACELMKMYHIDHLAESFPSSLSGGEKQRVALARIFASKPCMLLLDEPFSSLDTMLKLELIPVFKETLHSFGGISIMVSHNIGEILRICDNVSEIDKGCNRPFVTADEYYDIIRKRIKDSGLELFDLMEA